MLPVKWGDCLAGRAPARRAVIEQEAMKPGNAVIMGFGLPNSSPRIFPGFVASCSKFVCLVKQRNITGQELTFGSRPEFEFLNPAFRC